MKLKPQQGGCWYCHEDSEEEPLSFCYEFDTYIHITCIQHKIKTSKYYDPELEIIRKEFDL